MAVSGCQEDCLRFVGYPHELTFERHEKGGQTTANGKKTPDYKVQALVGDQKIQVGAAWHEQAEDGFSYYKTMFDNLGALFPEKLFVSLVPSRTEEGVCSLVWTSPAERAAFKAEKAKPEALTA